MSSHLKSGEVELRGSVVFESCRARKDLVSQRIEWLRDHHLQRLGSDGSGSDTLFRDPDDGRLWELVYLESQTHGGGPPTLRMIEAPAAARKYAVLNR